jgi:hypothetical protein
MGRCSLAWLRNAKLVAIAVGGSMMSCGTRQSWPAPPVSASGVRWSREWLFWFESLSIASFDVAWLVKGETLFNGAAAPAQAVPAEAVPAQAAPVDATAADGAAPDAPIPAA